MAKFLPSAARFSSEQRYNLVVLIIMSTVFMGVCLMVMYSTASNFDSTELYATAQVTLAFAVLLGVVMGKTKERVFGAIRNVFTKGNSSKEKE